MLDEAKRARDSECTITEDGLIRLCVGINASKQVQTKHRKLIGVLLVKTKQPSTDGWFHTWPSYRIGQFDAPKQLDKKRP